MGLAGCSRLEVYAGSTGKGFDSRLAASALDGATGWIVVLRFESAGVGSDVKHDSVNGLHNVECEPNTLIVN